MTHTHTLPTRPAATDALQQDIAALAARIGQSERAIDRMRSRARRIKAERTLECMLDQLDGLHDEQNRMDCGGWEG